MAAKPTLWSAGTLFSGLQVQLPGQPDVFPGAPRAGGRLRGEFDYDMNTPAYEG
ncbi:MAG: hypothetical protein WAU47_04085 [Desulfobaccales bacterium]